MKCHFQVLKSQIYFKIQYSKTNSMTTFAKNPKKPPPNAIKIQKVPLRPALDFLDKSHMIKNKNPIKSGSKPYKPSFVMVSLEMAKIIAFALCWMFLLILMPKIIAHNETIPKSMSFFITINFYYNQSALA